MSHFLDPLLLLADAQAQQQQPQACFQAIDQALAAAIGHRLFTILAYHPQARESQRVYTSQPAAYPVGGRKPVTDSPWMQQVIHQGQPYIGYQRQDIIDSFYDHELIFSLGCASVLNIPVRWRGQTWATVNLLHQENWYQPSHIPLSRSVAQMLLPALLFPRMTEEG